MKRWRFAIVAAVLVVTLGNTDPDDACVKRTIKNYEKGFEGFEVQFLNLQLKAEKEKDNHKEKTKDKERLQFKIRPAVPQVSDVFGHPYVDGQRIHTPFEHSDHEFINVVSYEINCEMPPHEIIEDDPYILDYPPPLPPYCTPAFYSNSGRPDPRTRAKLPARDKVITFAKSVGRLKVRSTYYLSEEQVEKSRELAGQCKKLAAKDKDQADKSKEPYTCEQVELWGTGFMVGQKTFATSCHVIAPLLKNVNGTPELDNDKLKSNHEKLVVNFTPTDVPANDQNDFEVKRLAGCSSRDGLDIALLEVDSSKGLPPPLPLFSGTIRDLARANNDFWRIGVLIGYGDLLHPIDETTNEMYKPYDKYNNVKVAMLDGIITEDECDDDLGIILDTVDTTVGESGSIVMDSLNWFNLDKPAFVLGVHTCCSAYFGLAQYTTLKPDLRCARLNRTFHNQDISSRSILRDRTLCPIISDDNGQIVDDQGTTKYIKDVKCSDLRWEWPLSWKTFYK